MQRSCRPFSRISLVTSFWSCVGAHVNSFERARLPCKDSSGRVVCPALPCRFVSVVRAPMQNRSGGSFEGTRVNSIGRVVRVGRSGGSFEGARVNSFGRVVRARAVSKMLSCDPRLALCTFVQLVCPALPCRFVSVVRAPMQNRSGGSFEGTRVNSFGRGPARAKQPV